MFEKILVPLDGSRLAQQVFSPVADLARAFGSEVVLMGVCEPEEKESGQTCRIYINNEAERLRERIGSSAPGIKTIVLNGKPAEQILSYAEENDVKLIVMTSHGRSGIAPWSSGGTVRNIIHKAGIPLIIVKARETPEWSDDSGLFNRILVPVDGSESGEAVLPHVTELTRRIKSEVILFRVVERGAHVHSARGLEYIPYKDLDMDSAKASALEYLEGLASRLSKTKAVVRQEVRIGDSAREIIKFAGEADCSIIAMTSHGHSGIEVWIHGSVTYKVMDAGNISVWFVPSAEAH